VTTVAETAAFLRAVRLFRDVAPADLEALAHRLRDRSLRKGQVLFREGDMGDEMFIVRNGGVIVSKAVTGRVEQVLARMGVGDFFGEMALFDRAARSATIQAEADCSLLVLDRDNLQRLVELNPRAAVAFFQALVHVFIERLRASGEMIAEVTRWGIEATGLDLDAR
jgi:CRP/FNR family cyclic AMP-dependent transcriptional regulator